MRAQTEAAIAQADAIFFLVDARVGLTPADRYFAQLVRRAEKPIILVANKAEGRSGEAGTYEAYRLGLGDPVPISAEHGEGLSELYEALVTALPELTAPIRRDASRNRADIRRSARKKTAASSTRRSLCASPSSGGPMPASRRSSIAFSARSGCSPGRKPASRATRSASTSPGTAAAMKIFDTAGLAQARQCAGQAREAGRGRRDPRGQIRRCGRRAHRRDDPLRTPGSRASPISSNARAGRSSSVSTNGISSPARQDAEDLARRGRSPAAPGQGQSRSFRSAASPASASRS